MERNSPPSLGRRFGFGDSLRRLRTRSGKSRYRLWQLTGLDQAFLARLETGEKNPGRNTVLLLGLALVHGSGVITCEDIDELLLAADYAPLHRRLQRTAR
jgi:predicted transcriptional regulator